MSKVDAVQELRVALTVEELDRLVAFYREGLGLEVAFSWDEPEGRGVILSAGRATLELVDEAQARLIDSIEVGERVTGPVRLALEVPDVDAAVASARDAGARLLNGPVVTPWRDRNARLVAPDGMQLTLFQRPREEGDDPAATEMDREHMRAAYEVARQAREHGNHPFGAVLVDSDNQILLSAENTVETESDCTGHAETNLMRLASARYSREFLATCTLYSSSEPCPMCAAAIHWGNVGRVVYGFSSASFYKMVGHSPHHLYLSCREVFSRSERPIEVIGPLLEEEGRLVHGDFWMEANYPG